MATQRSLELFLGTLSLDSDSWTFSYGPCPVQNNKYNCRIHVLVTALYIISGTKSRVEDKYGLWRNIFQGILGTQNPLDLIYPDYEEKKTAEIDCSDL